MSYKFYLNFIFILTGIYFSLTIIGKLYSPKSEIFPFFHWGLYVTTPQVIEKDYLDVYDNSNYAFEDRKSFYVLTEGKMSISEARFVIKQLKNCIDKSCFQPTLQQINKLLPNDSYSILYVKNEFSQIDTIGVIKNEIFIKK